MSFINHSDVIKRHKEALQNILNKWLEKKPLEHKPIHIIPLISDLITGRIPAFIKEAENKLSDESNRTNTLSSLQFMIFENEICLTLLDKFSKNLDTYAQKLINEFQTKILQECQTQNGKIDIHQFIQLLKAKLNNENHVLQKLQKHLKLWGNIYLYTCLVLIIALPLLAMAFSVSIPLFLTLCGTLAIPFELFSLNQRSNMLPNFIESPLLFCLITLLQLKPLFLGVNPFILALSLACSIRLSHGTKLIAHSKFIETIPTIKNENPYSPFEEKFFAQRHSTQQDPDIQSPADEVQAEFERLSLTA